MSTKPDTVQTDLSPEFSLRLLLTGGGTARSSQIGFRCAVDLQDERTREAQR